MNEKIIDMVKNLENVDENKIDTTNANNMIEYLKVKTYKQNTENVNYEAIEYLEYVKNKLQDCPDPDKVSNIRNIFVANEQSVNLNKYYSLKVKDGYNARDYDSMINTINNLLGLLKSREDIDKEKTSFDER